MVQGFGFKNAGLAGGFVIRVAPVTNVCRRVIPCIEWGALDLAFNSGFCPVPFSLLIWLEGVGGCG